jgi:hypothetical protein
MGRKALASVPAAGQYWSPLTSRINLTPAKPKAGQRSQSIEVALTELIAYSQNGQHTRLNLRGGKTLEVEETTQQIDRLVKAAASQS